jgi:hypothetical protein
VRAICRKYGLPYNTGGLGQQLLSVAKKIVSLALPDSAPQRPTPADRIVAAEPAAA